ncbi:MAG: response regulator [Elusimicrobia bacterium]|nr:response regulator [Elusimicrobiota bacterium]
MPRILIIDDDYSVRVMFQYLFLDAGYEVKLASNGQIAINCLSDFVPDLMLIDISMPIMTGPEFIKNLNNLASSRPELKGIPYIILTGENISESEREFGFQKDISCKFFLPKMTEHNSVLALVKKVLNKTD